MPSNNNKRREAEMVRMMVEQSRMSLPLQALRKASQWYLIKYPEEKRYAFENPRSVMRRAPNVNPRRFTYSGHSIARKNGAINHRLTNNVVRTGRFLNVRNLYYNTKAGVWRTNLGRVAPRNAKNVKQCPKHRITKGNVTAVVSYCYPMEAHNSREARWYPRVVTAYPNSKNVGRNHPN